MRTDESASLEALDMIDRLEAVGTKSDLLSMFFGQLGQFGYDRVLIAELPPPGNPFDRGIILNGWPPSWLERYTSREYYRQDQVAIMARRTTEPFLWSQAAKPYEHERVTQTIMGEARDHGLREGLVVPIYALSGDQFGVSMSGHGPDIGRKARRILHMLSMHVQHKAQVLTGKVRKLVEEEHGLTMREKDCLRWIALGKTDDDIAGILKLSRHTVSNHVRSSLAKLNAVTRAQAVAKAMVAKSIVV